MKKSYKILCLILASLMMTGCVKYEWKMSINKDKSMNYEIIVALPASMMQQADTDEMVDNEEVQSIKDAGFTVKDYSDGTMTGYTFTKKIANIDNVSSEKEVKYIYFIAETKGDLNSLQFRDSEKKKINCARKLYTALSSENLKYDVISDYERLLEIVKGK